MSAFEDRLNDMLSEAAEVAPNDALDSLGRRIGQHERLRGLAFWASWAGYALAGAACLYSAWIALGLLWPGVFGA